MYVRRGAAFGPKDLPELRGVEDDDAVVASPPRPRWATDGFWARHKWYVRGTAAMHLAGAIAAFVVGRKRDWPVTVCASYVTWAPDNPAVRCFEPYLNSTEPPNVEIINVCRIRQVYKRVGNLSLLWLIIFFFTLSFAFQMAPTLTSATWSLYRSGVERGVQSLRYIEYSISSTLMLVILLVLNGNTDLWLLLNASAANWSVMLFGLVQEQLSAYRSAAGNPGAAWWSLSAHVAGWVPFAATWATIQAQFLWAIDGVSNGDDTGLAIVKAIIWVQFTLFASFGFCQTLGTLAHTYAWKPTRWSYLHSELLFTVLSLVAKQSLCLMLLIGVLMRDPSKLIPASVC